MRTFNPLSTQISFVINTVKGNHLGKQCLLVSVNGHLFVLSPRTIQKRFRFYDSGFNIFIEPKEDIRISIAVFTPSNNQGYMHCFVSYKMQAPTKAKSQSIELHSYGNTYIISLSLYVSPSFIYGPVPNVNNQKPSNTPIDFKEKETDFDFNPESKNTPLERKKKKIDFDSFSDRYSLSYSISPTTDSSSFINLDHDEEKFNDKPRNPSLLNQLTEYSQTDETSTVGGSSDSDWHWTKSNFAYIQFFSE